MAARKKSAKQGGARGARGGAVRSAKRQTPPSVEKAKNTLILLAKSTPAAAKKIIENANRDVIKAISELSLNTLNGVVKLTPSQKLKLKRYKTVMRKISQKRVNIGDRKKLLQRGRGVIPILLRYALPLVLKGVASTVLGSLRKRRKR